MVIKMKKILEEVFEEPYDEVDNYEDFIGGCTVDCPEEFLPLTPYEIGLIYGGIWDE